VIVYSDDDDQEIAGLALHNLRLRAAVGMTGWLHQGVAIIDEPSPKPPGWGSSTHRRDSAADSLYLAGRAIIDSIRDCGRSAGQRRSLHPGGTVISDVRV
jgi:hypothetical protein